MNLAQALTESLADLPPARLNERPYQFHPQAVVREHRERDGLMYRIIVPAHPSEFFRFTSIQHQLARLFDGRRTYAEVAKLFRHQTGLQYSEKAIEEFARNLDRVDFWYKTPEEQCTALCESALRGRGRLVKHSAGGRGGDLSTIEVIYFNPDRYLMWLHSKVWWVYSRWFTVLSVTLLIMAIAMLATRWTEVWADSVLFFNLRQKTFWDVVQFFVIFGVMGALHETAHGLTCTHFGGHSTKMGAFLIYLVPAVFCDTAQVHVYGGRRERILTTLAGVWSELVLASLMTMVWWFTAPATFAHELAYKTILASGVMVAIINWNPLSKMDGYFLFCEITGFFDIKRQSSTFLSAWVRKNVFHMPAQVPNLPPLRQLGFATYAILSGIYCYGMLLFFTRVVYLIGTHYSPEWAFVPAGLIAFLVFRSRIQKVMTFCREFYMDKKAYLRQYPLRFAMAAMVLVAVLFVPLWHESISAPFVLRPSRYAILRVAVPGIVTAVMADEGDHVERGSTLVQLNDPQLKSELASSESDYKVSARLTISAELRNGNFSVPEQERQYQSERTLLAWQRTSHLEIDAPLTGTVLSANLRDLLGTYVIPGTELATIGDPSAMQARIFVTESELRTVQNAAAVALHVRGIWRPMEARIISISPAPETIEPGLIQADKYQGIERPNFYMVLVETQNERATLRNGMAGNAKIYGRRRSIAGLISQPFVDAAGRRLW